MDLRPLFGDRRYADTDGVRRSLLEADPPIVGVPLDSSPMPKTGDTFAFEGAAMHFMEECTEQDWRACHPVHANVRLGHPMKFFRVSLD